MPEVVNWLNPVERLLWQVHAAVLLDQLGLGGVVHRLYPGTAGLPDERVVRRTDFQTPPRHIHTVQGLLNAIHPLTPLRRMPISKSAQRSLRDTD